MKVHITHGGRTQTCPIPDQLVGLKIGSRILVAHHPRLVQAKDLMGFSQDYLVIRGGSGTDGTPMRSDFKGPRPLKIKWRDRNRVYRMRRFRPNQIHPNSIAVVDCIPIE